MAVYTTLLQQDIDSFLEQYEVGELLSFNGIAEGIENTNYLISTRDSRYILTMYEQRVDPQELPFFLGLTEWLADRGITCPRPLRGRDGRNVYALKGKSAALIAFLPGQGNPSITARHLELVGELMARMHGAAQGFALTRPNALSLAGWRALAKKIGARADEISAGLAQEMAAELAFLTAHWPRALPRGIIHADVFPDNVFFIDGQHDQPQLSGIIDFYFACDDFWSYDVVICMNAWCFSAENRFMPATARALWQGYDRQRPLTMEEKQALPVLARGAALRFLLTRLHDWLFRIEGALVTPKDPLEYVAKLRFHQSITDYREYGI